MGQFMKLNASGHLLNVLDPEQIPTTVRNVLRTIRQSKIEFDSIAFSGMSGALIAPIIALRLKKGMLVVRKESDESHGQPVEGCHGDSYIILDDFVGMGSTVGHISEQLSEMRCVGLFLYRRSGKAMSEVPAFGCGKGCTNVCVDDTGTIVLH